MASPFPVLVVVIFYVLVVRIVGPWLMKTREPYDLKGVMMIYNLVQTLFNSWMLWQAGRFWMSGSYSFWCQPIDYSDSATGTAAASLCWWYFINKILDYCDSFFFVLRKKYSHLSSLHVIHHGVMPLNAWWVTKYVGGGHAMFSGHCNILIHVIMYLYYFLSTLGPAVQPYLWWKRYLTQLQMIQFVLITVHSLHQLCGDCGYPGAATLVPMTSSLVFLPMFLQFYSREYKMKKRMANKKD